MQNPARPPRYLGGICGPRISPVSAARAGKYGCGRGGGTAARPASAPQDAGQRPRSGAYRAPRAAAPGQGRPAPAPPGVSRSRLARRAGESLRRPSQSIESARAIPWPSFPASAPSSSRVSPASRARRPAVAPPPGQRSRKQRKHFVAQKRAIQAGIPVGWIVNIFRAFALKP